MAEDIQVITSRSCVGFFPLLSSYGRFQLHNICPLVFLNLPGHFLVLNDDFPKCLKQEFKFNKFKNGI